MKRFAKIESEISFQQGLSKNSKVLIDVEKDGMRTIVVRCDYEGKVELWLYQSSMTVPVEEGDEEEYETDVDCIRLEDSVIRSLGWV